MTLRTRNQHHQASDHHQHQQQNSDCEHGHRLPLHNNISSSSSTTTSKTRHSKTHRSKLRHGNSKYHHGACFGGGGGYGYAAALILLTCIAVTRVVFHFIPSSVWPVHDTQRDVPLLEKQQKPQMQAVAVLEEKYKSEYDVVILGCGPAGLTAALFSARAGLDTLVLGSTAGGSSLLSETAMLDNFPSWTAQSSRPSSLTDKHSGTTGQDWLAVTQQQARHFGASFAPPGLLASAIDYVRSTPTQTSFALEIPGGNTFFPPSNSNSNNNNGQIRAKSLILATGATPRKLNLPNEAPLWGRSLHNCALCDGFLYHSSPSNPHSTVVVVGGGDAAVDAALLLSRNVYKVYLIHRRTSFRASNGANVKALKRKQNVEFFMPFKVTQWETARTHNAAHGQAQQKAQGEGPGPLVAVHLQSTSNPQQTRVISAQGAFVLIGATPNTSFLQSNPRQSKVDVKIDANTGLIQLASSLSTQEQKFLDSAASQTSVPGIFAAGEAADGVYRQAITAAASGAQAAIDAERWLRLHDNPAKAENENENENETTNGNQASNGKPKVQKDAPKIQLSRQAKQPAAAAAMPPPLPQTKNQDKRLDNSSNNNNNQNQDPNLDDPQCNLTNLDCLQTIINTHPVVVFSKPYCPYCQKAIEALQLSGLSHPYVIDLTTKRENDHGEVQMKLAELSRGRRTVPNVFVGGKSIGGGDETFTFYRNQRLRGMLVKAGAIVE